MIKDWKKELFTIPNLLSLFRMGLIPVYATLYLHAQSPTDYYLAAAILAVSCLTDAIDGQIARRFHMISTVGKILDPLADKATQLTLIICIALRRHVLWILVGLFVIKEGFQLVAGWLSLRQGRMLTGALLPGKISTAVLFVSLIILVLIPGLESSLVWLITGTDCAVLLVAFGAYIHTYSTRSAMIQDLPENG